VIPALDSVFVMIGIGFELFILAGICLEGRQLSMELVLILILSAFFAAFRHYSGI